MEYAYNRDAVLHDVRLKMHSGEMVGIIGPNGAGKSTLMKLISGILSLQKGLIYIRDKRISEVERKNLARLLSYVPQSVDLFFDFTTEQVVKMGRYPFLKGIGFLDEGARPAIEYALQKMDLKSMRHRSF